jgi:hypothetical protein
MRKPKDAKTSQSTQSMQKRKQTKNTKTLTTHKTQKKRKTKAKHTHGNSKLIVHNIRLQSSLFTIAYSVLNVRDVPAKQRHGRD